MKIKNNRKLFLAGWFVLIIMFISVLFFTAKMFARDSSLRNANNQIQPEKSQKVSISEKAEDENDNIRNIDNKENISPTNSIKPIFSVTPSISELSKNNMEKQNSRQQNSNEKENFEIPKLIFKGSYSGNKIKVLIAGDGYVREDFSDTWDYRTSAGKFEGDAYLAKDVLLSVEPFRSNNDKFEIYAVRTVSSERLLGVGETQGINENGRKSLGNTYFKSVQTNQSNYVICENDYLMDELSNKYGLNCNMNIIILNTNKEAGGAAAGNATGNPGCAYSSKNSSVMRYMLIHEVGHAFCGLKDEYVDNQDNFCVMNDMYSMRSFCGDCIKKIRDTIKTVTGSVN